MKRIWCGDASEGTEAHLNLRSAESRRSRQISRIPIGISAEMSASKVVVFALLIVAAVVVADESWMQAKVVKVEGRNIVIKGGNVKGHPYVSISDYFHTDQFENLLPKRNSPVAHDVGFGNY